MRTATRPVVQDKYSLRDMHKEISLFDRKLLHLHTHEVFATEEERDAAARKLSLKRESLVTQARAMHAAGIEFEDHEVPRSLRPADWVDPNPRTDTAASPAEVADAVGLSQKSTSAFGQSVARLQAQRSEEESPLATALGSWQTDLAAYKKRRQKTSPAIAG